MRPETRLTIRLAWPPSILSGHAKGRAYYKRAAVTKDERANAAKAARDAMDGSKPVLPAGDIPIHIRFVPPDRRGDRINFPNRIKPALDGIADALKVNDARFLPTYEFAEPEKPGRVEVTL